MSTAPTTEAKTQSTQVAIIGSGFGGFSHGNPPIAIQYS